MGRGAQLRTGRPCSQVPGSRWRTERLVRRQRVGVSPPAPTPRVRAPASASLPLSSAPARQRRFLSPPPALAPGDPAMPVRTECTPPAGASAASAASLIPPPPINTQQPGVATSLLYSGSKFRGHQKSKGNSYDVEVVLQVSAGPGRRGPEGLLAALTGRNRPRLFEPAAAGQALTVGPPAPRRFTLGPAQLVLHSLTPNPDLPPHTPVVSSSWQTLNTLPDSKPETHPPSIRKPPMSGHPQTWDLPMTSRPEISLACSVSQILKYSPLVSPDSGPSAWLGLSHILQDLRHASTPQPSSRNPRNPQILRPASFS